MPKSSFSIILICAAFLIQAARAENKSLKLPSPLKDWNEPNISLKLQDGDKQSDTERELSAHRSSARSLYRERRYEEAAREYQKCVDLDPTDLEANLGVGYCLYNLRRYQEALAPLGKARLLKPDSYSSNFWSGVSLARLGRFKEAIPLLEKALVAKTDDSAARRELFVCYLIAGQPQNGFHLYPTLIAIVGSVLLFVFLVWFAALLPFSLPLRTASFPGLRFSIAWLGLFLEGQFAFLFLLSALPGLHLNETVLAGIILAGLPVIVVAASGFARQPWGVPFRWPLRLGSSKALLISLLLVLLLQVMSVAFSQLYTWVTNKPAPLQNAIPLIQNALSANPVVAWLAVAFFIPLTEEILFRGLLFGAFEKRWGIKGAMLASAFLFACIHFQFIGFLGLFCFGLVLGWARWRSTSLGPPILIHSLNNIVALLAMTFSGTPATS
jgi:membrane protease YdiL (CAAX protease family)/Flp pilus assembly protein TadD